MDLGVRVEKCHKFVTVTESGLLYLVDIWNRAEYRPKVLREMLGFQNDPGTHYLLEIYIKLWHGARK